MVFITLIQHHTGTIPHSKENHTSLQKLIKKINKSLKKGAITYFGYFRKNIDSL